MTLLRRTPCEVYRLYDEDEFFGEGEFFATSTPGEDRGIAERLSNESRRLQRFAGATILFAVVGVVGGIVAITSVATVAGTRRRSIGRLSAASGSVRARGGVEPAHASQAVTAHLGRFVERSGIVAHVGRTSRGIPAGKSFAASGYGGRNRRGGSHGVSRPWIASIPGPNHFMHTGNPEGAVSVAVSWTGTPVSAPKSVQAEFGFER